MKGTTKKYLSVLIALCVVLTPLIGVFPANGDHITVNLTGVETSVSLETGELYLLPLANIFNEPNSGHTVTYDVDGINGTILGPHTHIAYPNGVPTLVFTEANADTYEIIVSASCSGNDYAEFSMTFTVILASDGTPSQYGYNENDIDEDDTVRVYVTISNDGMPIKGTDGTIMANLEVDLPYINLSEYALTDYYRYGTNGGGEYVDTTVVKRPTALHLYLYLIANHYITPANSVYPLTDLLDYTFTQNKTIQYMDGTTAYTATAYQDKAIDIEGSATSLYLTSFWGHDCNLMYFRNHVFPLMSPGWGATCDYALLSDGDVIEIAMFTDWGFYSDGAFLRFNGYDKYASCTKSKGQTLTVYTQGYDTTSMGSYNVFENTEDELTVAIYTSTGTLYGYFTWAGNDSNIYSYTLPNNMPDGIYYVVAMDPDARTSAACMAPAVMTVAVH